MFKLVCAFIAGLAAAGLSLLWIWPTKPPRAITTQNQPQQMINPNVNLSQSAAAIQTPPPPPIVRTAQETAAPLSPATTTLSTMNGQCDSPSSAAPMLSTASPAPSVSSSSSSSTALAPQTSPEIMFIIRVNDNETTFAKWADASSELDRLPADPQFSLSVQFSSSIITDNWTEDQFRGWLTGVNEYIFARRMILVNKLVEVIRNIELRKVKPCDTHKQGFALFTPQPDRWKVTIRGLEKYRSELKGVIEKIIIPALNNPTTMAVYQPLKSKKISLWFKDAGIHINENQMKLVDGLLKSRTIDDEMHKQKIDNLNALLPLVKFEDLPSADKQKIIDARNKFLQQFIDNDLKGTAEMAATMENVGKMYDNEANYRVFRKLIRQWVEDNNISDLVLGSLFTNTVLVRQ